MTPDQTLDLLRAALTLAAPALVLAAGLKRLPQPKPARVVAPRPTDRRYGDPS